MTTVDIPALFSPTSVSIAAEIERLRAEVNQRALAWTKYTDSLEQELEQQRAAAIEECVLVIESCSYQVFRTRAGLAAAIRALKEKP